MPSFDEDAIRRIAETVRRMEQTPVNSLPPSSGPRIILPARVGKTSSAITARAGTVRGTGTCALYVDDGSGTGTDRVLMTNVTVWNPYTAVIPTAKWVTLNVIDGQYYIIGVDC